MNNEENNTEQIYCNECGRETNHRIVHSYRNNVHSENLANNGVVYASIDWHIDWEMFECQGCDMVLLRQKTYCSEWYDPYDNNDPHKYTYYPLRNTGGRAKPQWYDSLLSAQELKGHFILTAYQQIYLLLESEHYLSAMLACRALLETVAIEKGGGDLRTFEEKLKALEKNGFILEKQIKYLNNTYSMLEAQPCTEATIPVEKR